MYETGSGNGQTKKNTVISHIPITYFQIINKRFKALIKIILAINH
jgi:hypothetical protein